MFEGALGQVAIEDARSFQRAVKRRKWERAVRTHKLNELLVAQIWWLFWHQDMRIEIVTFMGDEFARELETFLNEEDVPVSRVWATTPQRLARKIAYMPDLAAVYDPDPNRRFTYGGKGRVLVNPSDLGR